MNILSNTAGTFTFVLNSGEEVTYTDFRDVPPLEELDLKHVIAFKPEIWTIQQEPETYLQNFWWGRRLTEFMEKERSNASSNKNR